MLNGVYYFKVGNKDIRVSLPEDSLGRFFTFIMIGIFVFDLFVGHLFGAFLMALFIAMNTVQMK